MRFSLLAHLAISKNNFIICFYSSWSFCPVKDLHEFYHQPFPRQQGFQTCLQADQPLEIKPAIRLFFSILDALDEASVGLLPVFSTNLVIRASCSIWLTFLSPLSLLASSSLSLLSLPSLFLSSASSENGFSQS